MIVEFCLVYLVAHFLTYVIVVRRSPWFRSERNIFLFHAVSAAWIGLLAVLYTVFEPAPATFGWPGGILILSLHGIYSLSFLELWSLAQGGYSLSVLAKIKKAQETGMEVDFSSLERIGETKQTDRLRSLAALGLIRVRGEYVSLTRRGLIAAYVLIQLLNWSATKEVLR